MNREFWNQRYGQEDYVYGREVNSYLAAQAARLSPGMSALAVADGEGRNGVWLARQGLEVLSVDQSEAGLKKAAQLASEHGVCLSTLCTDLTEWGWRRDGFDLVIAIYAHFPPAVRASLHRSMIEALKPGGLLILEAFRKQQLGLDSGGPKVLEMLFSAEILAEDFQGLEFIELLEGSVALREGAYHSGDGEVVRLLARKPA